MSKIDSALAYYCAMEASPAVNAVPLNDLPPKDKDTGNFDGQASQRKYQKWIKVELVALCVLMAIVWALLTLPIIFYYLPFELVSRV